MTSSSPAKSKLFAALLGFLAISGSIAQALVPNSQEQEIASLMSSNPDQHRSELVSDPILAAVARARAMDMAARKYFAHVNPDGIAANYLISHAGYALPAWWPTDPANNYVESIGAGYPHAQDVWNAWMGSTPHRTHLLALDSGGFYAKETRYGIGYVNIPGSESGTYWVVITAPPAGVYVTSPEGGSKLLADGVTVSGTAPGDLGITSVTTVIKNHDGTTSPVVATGTSDWSVTLQGLVKGLNTVQVQGKDVNDEVVSETSIDLTYTPMSPLVVTVSGSGSVTAAFSGTTSQEVGTPLVIVATPAKGFLFAGWTGDIQSSSAQLKFIMQQDLSLQANFVANPFPVAKGAYTGLMVSGTTGDLSLQLTNSGVFTGKVYLGTTAYRFSGRFSPLGQADLAIKRTGTTSLSLYLELALDGSQEVTGTISDGTLVSAFASDLATFGKNNPAPQAGNYTMVFAPSISGTTNPPSPAGNGVATLRINAAGVAVISGQLADNTHFSSTANLSKNGTLPLFVPLPKNQGLLAGTLTFENLAGSDASGKVLWTTPASLKNKDYPLGFSITLDASASLYIAPTGTLMAANALPSSELVIADGAGSVIIDCPATVTASAGVQFSTPPPCQLHLSSNPKTGSITGSFVIPSTNAKCSVHAVYFQKLGAAFGYFSGPGSEGSVSLQ